MMRGLLLTATALALLCSDASGAGSRDMEPPPKDAALSAEDMEVVAQLEFLQLWELAEESEMMEEINLLMEDDQNDF